MNAELKAKWVAALRSGQYQQMRGRLCDGGKTAFCCLGVLCMVDSSLAKYLDDEFYGGIDGLLNNKRDTLVTMNDDDRKSFPEIADWIEQNL